VRNPISMLRLVSLAEGTSFLLLLLATLVKYGADQPIGVRLLGPIHGLLFLAFVVLVLNVRGDLRWGGKATVLALLAGVVPAGAFVLERKLREAAPATA
jgi:integral membrane protein